MARSARRTLERRVGLDSLRRCRQCSLSGPPPATRAASGGVSDGYGQQPGARSAAAQDQRLGRSPKANAPLETLLVKAVRGRTEAGPKAGASAKRGRASVELLRRGIMLACPSQSPSEPRRMPGSWWQTCLSDLSGEGQEASLGPCVVGRRRGSWGHD